MSAVQYPDDENGDALRHMAEQGVDLTALHKLDFEHVFPDEKSARQFAQAVGSSVLETVVHSPEDPSDDDEWEVQCRVRMVPSHAEISATEQRLEAMASEFGGYADGWGLMSNPDGSPAD
jgi:hypothetical protein